MHTTQEFQLFNTSVSLHGDWFSPAQDPDFEAMAAWWSGKADGKTTFYKMHEHLENHYKKWTGKKRENENMMNSLNKGKEFRREFRHQAMLQRFLNHCHISIITVWRISITNSPWQRKLGEK
jgi:hypothetical protein